jgi:hypothetical protein
MVGFGGDRFLFLIVQLWIRADLSRQRLHTHIHLTYPLPTHRSQGYGATLLSFGPFSAFYFLFYEQFKHLSSTTLGVPKPDLPFHWTLARYGRMRTYAHALLMYAWIDALLFLGGGFEKSTDRSTDRPIDRLNGPNSRAG